MPFDRFGNFTNDGTQMQNPMYQSLGQNTYNQPIQNAPFYQNVLSQANAQQPVQVPQQQQIVAPAVQGILGRIVTSQDEIMPNEIPMDGRTCLFPASDASYIVTKKWNSNGNLETRVYKPETPEIKSPPANEDTIKSIMARLDKMDNTLTKLSEALS